MSFLIVVASTIFFPVMIGFIYSLKEADDIQMPLYD